MKTRTSRPGNSSDSGYSLLQTLLETLCVLLVVLGAVSAYTGLIKTAEKVFSSSISHIQAENTEVTHELAR